MNTPICDYVNRYLESDPLRLHMPGHKGATFLGLEKIDITEIDGADSLYHADGIILESQENASALFGCPTWYSTEGSSHCIRAMLYLVLQYAKARGQKPQILSARNVHSTFLSAVALLDMDVEWIYPENHTSYLTCNVTPTQLEQHLSQQETKPTALYITSPDYLGNVADVAGLAKVCHANDMLLVVDNAHGAYLRFLVNSEHPVDLGADICCDSAHKTLPVLTGGAYLHVAQRHMEEFNPIVSKALALFGSTSPSYVILQSLDMANVYMETLRKRLMEFVPSVVRLKARLKVLGFKDSSQEYLKICLTPKTMGYTGTQLAEILKSNGIYCEFADQDYLVLMLTPEIGEEGINRFSDVMAGISHGEPIDMNPPKPCKAQKAMSVREATLSPMEMIDVEESLGRILANPSVSCPPAVPILVCGERIDQQAIDCFRYYGVKNIYVVRGAET